MTEKRLQYIAQHIAQWTYGHLVAVVGLDDATAKRVAANAADKAAESLAQDCR